MDRGDWSDHTSSRLAVIAGCLSKAQAAREYGVSAKIVSRWTGRFRAERMQDRSSRPKLIQTAEPLAGRLITLCRPRLCGKHIALQTGVSPAKISRVLRRAGLSRMKDPGPTGTGCAL